MKMYKWYLLMERVEKCRQKTGYGYAHTWGLINAMKYPEALEDVIRIEADVPHILANRRIKRRGYAEA